MSKQQIEIEKRYEVKDKANLLKWLEKKATKLYEHHHIENYYTPVHRDFLEPKIPIEWLRIRNADGKYSITYKYWHTDGKSEGTHCDEYETDLEDGEQLKSIFKALDFKVLAEVDKHRIAFSSDIFEITVDEVKNLGVFCEIEVKSDDISVDEAHSKLDEFAKELGFSEDDRGEDLKLGYVYALIRKNLKTEM